MCLTEEQSGHRIIQLLNECNRLDIKLTKAREALFRIADTGKWSLTDEGCREEARRALAEIGEKEE